MRGWQKVLDDYGVLGLGFQEEEECWDDWLYRNKKTDPHLWSLYLHMYSQTQAEKPGVAVRTRTACSDGGSSNCFNRVGWGVHFILKP